MLLINKPNMNIKIASAIFIISNQINFKSYQLMSKFDYLFN